jgi:hypothetical protein
MSILGYVYLPDVAGTDTELGTITTPAILPESPVSGMMVSNYASSLPGDWYRQKAFGDTNSDTRAAYFVDEAFPILVTEFPALSKELWIRFMDYNDQYSEPGRWNYDRESLFAKFFNITNGVKKLVAVIRAGSNSATPAYLYYDLYGPDGTTVIKTHAITEASKILSNSNGDGIVDLRFSFDKTAGFIQHYDYTGTRVAEVLGKTIDTLPVTHIVLYSDVILPSNSSISEALSRIVANEPTFGMYVMPFYAKAEGTDQQHLSGNYSRFSMSRYSFSKTTGVGLEKPESGEAAHYSYVPKTLLESGLPANYNVLSLQVNSVVDAITPTGDPVVVNTYLKQVSTGTRFEIPQVPVKSNIDSAITKRPQVRTSRWDKNPVTGRNWQPGDLVDFEIGFKI